MLAIYYPHYAPYSNVILIRNYQAVITCIKRMVFFRIKKDFLVHIKWRQPIFMSLVNFFRQVNKFFKFLF